MSLLHWSADGDISLSVSHGIQAQMARGPLVLNQDLQNNQEMLFSLPYKINLPAFHAAHPADICVRLKRSRYCDASQHGFISCCQSFFATFVSFYFMLCVCSKIVCIVFAHQPFNTFTMYQPDISTSCSLFHSSLPAVLGNKMSFAILFSPLL